jgi:hypothetical protein
MARTARAIPASHQLCHTPKAVEAIAMAVANRPAPKGLIVVGRRSTVPISPRQKTSPMNAP